MYSVFCILYSVYYWRRTATDRPALHAQRLQRTAATMPTLAKKAMLYFFTWRMSSKERKRIFDQLDQVDAEQDAAGRGKAAEGAPVPDCTLLNVTDGTELKLRDLEKSGKPLVLNFGSCS